MWEAGCACRENPSEQKKTRTGTWQLRPKPGLDRPRHHRGRPNLTPRVGRRGGRGRVGGQTGPGQCGLSFPCARLAPCCENEEPTARFVGCRPRWGRVSGRCALGPRLLTAGESPRHAWAGAGGLEGAGAACRPAPERAENVLQKPGLSVRRARTAATCRPRRRTSRRPPPPAFRVGGRHRLLSNGGRTKRPGALAAARAAMTHAVRLRGHALPLALAPRAAKKKKKAEPVAGLPRPRHAPTLPVRGAFFILLTPALPPSPSLFPLGTPSATRGSTTASTPNKSPPSKPAS